MPPKFDVVLLLQQDYWPVLGDINNKVGFLTPKMMVQVGFTPSMNFLQKPGIVLQRTGEGGCCPTILPSPFRHFHSFYDHDLFINF